MLDPKLVGEAALPLAEVEKIPGCRPNKDPDIAEAEKLVKKHHPNGIDIEMAFRQVGNYSDRSQLVAAQLRRIGIRGTLKTHESAAGYAAFGKGDFTLITAQDRAMGRHRPVGPVLPDLDDPGRQQLRQVVGSEVRRACGARAEGDEQGRAREGVSRGAAALPERRSERDPGGLGGRLVLCRQERAQLQALAVRLRQHHLHEGVAGEVIGSVPVEPCRAGSGSGRADALVPARRHEVPSALLRSVRRPVDDGGLPA